MIVSVSRRTDIPAFYSEWFFDKIEKGYVNVVNPYNSKQVSKIALNPDAVDCFVFWTKNPKPMIEKLNILDEKGFKYYFQFTLTSYQSEVEPGLKDKNDVIATFKKLSEKIGKDRVIWRYDPIMLSEAYTKEYHYKWFEALCKRLQNHTEKCVISFVDMYGKTKRNTKDLGLYEITAKDMNEMAKNLSKIARKYEISIETCSEGIDLTTYNISKGKCIDDRMIEKIIGCPVSVKKDEFQRETCGCVKSIDIGQYNTCKHFCAYCYANFNHDMVIQNGKNHDVSSSVLIGQLSGEEKIKEKEMKSIKENTSYEQMTFDLA